MGTPPQEEGLGTDVSLDGLSVALLLETFDPLTANPDYLKWAGIVDPDLSIGEPPPLITPDFSRVFYDGGLIVSAGRQYLLVDHTGSRLVPESVAAPTIAAKFIEKADHVRLMGIDINPTCRMTGGGLEKTGVTQLLLEHGDRFKLGETAPESEVTTRYSMGDKVISVEIEDLPHQEDRPAPAGVSFRGTFHRDLREIDPANRIRDALQALRSWEKDLGEFRALLDKYSVWEQRS